MQNFTINLPSIPSPNIKFKIQNGKFKAFNAKQARFKDNLTYLTTHFIQSFPNLSTPKKNPTEKQKMNNSQIYPHSRKNVEYENDKFRWMIPDTKKNLLLKYEEEYKDYLPQIVNENKYDKGYSFPKSTPKDTLDSELQSFPSYSLQHQPSYIIDNYYFKGSKQEIQKDIDEKDALEKRRAEKINQKKVVRKSAAFQGEDRWKSFDRELNNKIQLGPGSYLVETAPQNKTANKELTKPLSKKVNITKVLEILNSPNNPETSVESRKKESKADKTTQNKSSMFIEGNTDRFGNQIHPINPHLKVPGPGAYNYSDSLQDKANHILVLQEQRKLLKEWYSECQ